MKFASRFIYLLAAGALMAASCAKEMTESYDEYENLSLRAWMTQHRPHLLENFQADEEGFGYYVDIESVGDMKAAPVSDTICWVSFDFSGRDLSGRIVLTRNAAEAKLVDTYTKYTHYVPFYRYCGETNSGLLDGAWLAMRNTLKLGDAYFAANKERLGITSPQVQLREGARVTLYMPSLLVGSGLSGDGGYEGETSLSSRRPLIVTLEIRDTVKNPLEKEGIEVDDFCKSPLNGGLRIYNKDEDDKTSEPLPADPEDADHPYRIAERWVSANDTIPQVYVNYRFDPARDRISFPEEYNVGFEPYNAFAAMEEKINKALVERFHPDENEPYAGVLELGDSVKLDGKAKIWYIGRFLDGFIFDTNIDEVKQIVYGEVLSKGTALEYTPEEGGLITAFYYTVPNLKFGQWASLVTTSTNGYGSAGKAGSSSTSSSSSSNYSSSYLDYINYLNYANSYYGSGGYYGGYYGNYYGGYGGGYYNPYYGYGYGYGYDYDYGSDSDTTTKTTVSTEIPPFTPLLFEFYVEPKE